MQRVSNKQAILRNTARKKYVVIVGDQYKIPEFGHSTLPTLHLNTFGHIRVYCPTFNDSFWIGKLHLVENFSLDTDSCPIKSYIRYEFSSIEH